MGLLNLDTMPDTAYEKPQEGTYVFEITRCELVTAKSTGSKMLQFDYVAVDNKEVKVNYDNAPFEDASGNGIRMGLVKIKKILQATNTQIKGDFDVKILPKLLLGKKLTFKAEYKDANSKYLELKNMDSIVPAMDVANATPEMFMVEPNVTQPKQDAKPADITILSEQDWEI